MLIEFAFSSFIGNAQDKKLIENLLRKDTSSVVKLVLDSPTKYRLQIIYTQIKRKRNGKPKFTQYTYRLNEKEYFYPASLVKLPVCALALQKINELEVDGLDKNNRMITTTDYDCQTPETKDSTAKDGYPALGHYIKKMLLVSDNMAFNRAYEFLGQEYIHKNLAKKKYKNARILHRFWGCDTLMNRHTNPISFYDSKGEILYEQEGAFYTKQLSNPLGDINFGKGRLMDTVIVYKPKNFKYNNSVSLMDETEILKSILFPKSVGKKKRFKLTEEDYTFLRKYLFMYPSQSDYPNYKTDSTYFDAYKKYLYYGKNPKLTLTDSSLKIYNIVGQALGFTADCAYFFDPKTKTEFMLSAVIYTNADGILYDDKYEYNSIAFPFLERLGKDVYLFSSKP